MMRSLIVAAALALLAVPAAGQQYPTIVGEWYAEEIGAQDCGTPHAFHIGPMHYVEEALVCEFKDVRRDGWRVTWNGSCNDGSSSSKTQVVALEESGQLSMWFNGNPGWTTLRRCDAKMSAMQTPRPATAIVAAPSVAPEIAEFCEDRWGTNYSMQLYCREKEMDALRELRAGDVGMDYRPIVELALDHAVDAYRKGGIEALADYNAMCYAAVSSVPFHLACVATDYLGGLVRNRIFRRARNQSPLHRLRAFRGAAGHETVHGRAYGHGRRPLVAGHRQLNESHSPLKLIAS